MASMRMLRPVGYPANRAAGRWAFDALVTLLAWATAALYYNATTHHPPGVGPIVVLALMVAPLVVRRIWPIPMFGVVVAAAIGAVLWDRHLVDALALFIAVYTVAAQQGALAAAAERARIAREMHDVVAHHLTVMVTLSEAAAAASASSPERAAEVMRSVSATGRRALADTRRLLGMLRQRPGQDPAAALAPVPDLTQLDALIEEVRSAGLQTTLEVHGQSAGIASKTMTARLPGPVRR
jgi:signal transduction histidine kinase